MHNPPAWTWWTTLMFLAVLGCAAMARLGYVAFAAQHGQRQAAFQVQGVWPRAPVPAGTTFRSRKSPSQLDNLVENMAEQRAFRCMAPLAREEELTAHAAPGFVWIFGMMAQASDAADAILRWLHAALGSLTVALYFLFARRAFHNTLIATLAGLLTAFYPFWIINTAELNDGVLVSFLLSLCLVLGARGSQNGGAFTGLLFGVALAGLVMVRAALLPFALVALLWYVWQGRRLALGWFAGFLAVIGFVNGLAPWGVRNYQVFGQPIPVADSMYLHLWMGNNPQATGSMLDEAVLRRSLADDRRDELLNEPNQALRYHQLAVEFWREVEAHPAETLSRRIDATLVFLLGEHWFKEKKLAGTLENGPDVAEPPAWMRDHAELILPATLMAVFFLAWLGWRWSHAWRRYGRIAAIAVVWVPLPYVLSHAEYLSGPRLPLDGILLCYAAYALASMIPGVRSQHD